jgi:hypothetical protein
MNEVIQLHMARIFGASAPEKHCALVKVPNPLMRKWQARSPSTLVWPRWTLPTNARARYPLYVRWLSTLNVSITPPKEVVDEIFSFVPLWTKGRKVFVTQMGFLGLGPAEVEPGDVARILSGGNLPYVVRPLGQNEFTFLGPSYVHGIMNGEAYHGADQTRQETFVPV